MSDRQLSPHFSLYDLTVTEHLDLLAENRNVTDEEERKLCDLANLLETARAILGCDLDIHSGRRVLRLNERVGGSVRSEHLRCQAADFSAQGPDTEESVKESWEKLRTCKTLKFGQLIFETDTKGREGRSSWVHISLGAPHRDPARCGEAFKMVDGKTV